MFITVRRDLVADVMKINWDWSRGQRYEDCAHINVVASINIVHSVDHCSMFITVRRDLVADVMKINWDWSRGQRYEDCAHIFFIT